ncbi:hypothetical protein PSTT_03530 [Puccinia striiformis]|uniref:Uncharacterized protein n=1 Tax=Puccinia striiformis TaxID=27350 RepID=A0A2S4VVV8_9BASI|nr:hypothetical protein PSTT_03530 [Puccinia striiformis]
MIVRVLLDNPQPTTLKRKRPRADTELPPSKYRRLEFMVSEAMILVAGTLLICLGMLNQNGFQNDQSPDTWDSNGSKLVTIHSIFKLTRCYLALSDFEKAQITLQELYSTSSEAAIVWGHSLFNELANLHSEIEAKLGVERNTFPTLQGTEIATLERSLKSVQLCNTSMICHEEHEAAVQLISKTLASVCINVQKLGKTSKDLLVELRLSLTERYIYLDQPNVALLALEQGWDPKKDLSIWWGHRLFNRMATLYYVLTKKDP